MEVKWIGSKTTCPVWRLHVQVELDHRTQSGSVATSDLMKQLSPTALRVSSGRLFIHEFYTASNWNSYLFLSLGSKTGAALQSVMFEEWQQWRQQ